MLDLETGNIKDFGEDRYKTIVKFKTSFYTFHAPVVGALIFTGIDTYANTKVAEEISIKIGELISNSRRLFGCIWYRKHNWKKEQIFQMEGVLGYYTLL
eukprot:UN01837